MRVLLKKSQPIPSQYQTDIARRKYSSQCRTVPASRITTVIVFGVLTCVALCFHSRVGLRAAEILNATQGRLAEDIKYLASDELEGRGVGTEGLNLAADYIRQEFAKAGLDVSRVDGDAFQKFSMVTGSELTSPNTLAFVGPDGAKIDLQLDADFRPCSFGGAGTLATGLVFCGYGIDAPKLNYNDFGEVDVKGKVAIILRRVPRQSEAFGAFSSPHGSLSRHAELRNKVSNAVNAGAAGIVFVNDPYSSRKEAEDQLESANKNVVKAAIEFDAVSDDDAEKRDQARQRLAKAIAQLKETQQTLHESLPDSLMEFGYGGRGNSESVPIFHITQDACNRLLEQSLKTNLAKLEAEIDAELKPKSTVLEGWSAQGVASMKQLEVNVKNVIGVLEGEGPLADETIVIGAHYDHLGRGGQGSLARGSNEIHNGADDNASGTVALIELARRFGTAENKPKRRLVFIAFTGEELGLIGSARYCREPLFPLEKTIAMFNMDMVGRVDDGRLLVYGTGTSSRWTPQVEEFAKEYGFNLSLKPEGFGPSDHSSFYAKKIPVLHFFTDMHSDYHRPSDDWEKINFSGMEHVIGLVRKLVAATESTDERPDYQEVKGQAQIARTGSRPYFGSIPDFGSNEPGYAISGASPGSPADKGGLKGGDRIVDFGGNKITGLDDFDLALRKFAAGDEVDVIVIRNSERVSLKITLEKPR